MALELRVFKRVIPLFAYISILYWDIDFAFRLSFPYLDIVRDDASMRAHITMRIPYSCLEC